MNHPMQAKPAALQGSGFRPGWVCALALSLTACSLPQTGIMAPAARLAAAPSPSRALEPSRPAASESQVRVQAGPKGEQLRISLRFERSLRTQAASTADLAFVRIELRGEGLSPRFANDGALIPVVNGTVTASLNNLPRTSGALRLITLRGYDADGNELPGFELRGWYRSGSASVSPALGRRDLLLGRVLEELLTDRPTDLVGLDVGALQTQIDIATGYDPTSRRLFVTDPTRFLPFVVTDLIPAGGGPLPNAAEITSNALAELETVELRLETPRGRAFGETVTVTIDDPGSKPARLAAGAADDSTVTLPDISPGNWTLRAYGADGELLGETTVEVSDGVALVDQDPLPLPAVRELILPQRVNGHLPDKQEFGDVAITDAGLCVVVWESDFQDGSGAGIFARRYASDGTALGPEFQVNQQSTDRQAAPDIAIDGESNLLIVWQSEGQDGSGAGIFARRYASDGTALGDEFQVNQVTANRQYEPQVAMNADGDAVFTWTSQGPDGDGDGIVARRYTSAGSFAGSEFLVNIHFTDQQQDPCVAIDAEGDFVIGWYNIDTQNGDTRGIFARAYDRDGSPIGAEIHANSDHTEGEQSQPRVALDSDGDFVMAWASADQDGASAGIVVRRFDRSGTALGPGVLVNSAPEHDELAPSLAMDPDGDFTVGWSYYEYDADAGYYYGNTFARRFQADGTPEGGAFRINPDDHALNNYTRLAQSAAGLAATFMSNQYDSSDYNVYLMRYNAAGEPF